MHERHPAYRTKDQMVLDVAYVLAAPLSRGTKQAVLQNVAWAWTEFHGKYKGCPFWTRGALAWCESDPRAKLRHEHAVPKAVVLEMLFKLEGPASDSVRHILESFLLGVVVTPDEDRLLNARFRKSMPQAFADATSTDFHNPWLRYKQVGIEVVCCYPDKAAACHVSWLAALSCDAR
jgi:hypothetical protein